MVAGEVGFLPYTKLHLASEQNAAICNSCQFAERAEEALRGDV